MKLIRVEGDRGKAEFGGVIRDISLALVPDAAVGDYVLIHAGFAIEKLNADDAARNLDVLAQAGIEDGD
jgi:hydrogenase expression/formation protein HypC